MPKLFDKHTVLYDDQIPSLDAIEKLAEQHNQWLGHKGIDQPWFSVTPPTIQDGVFDFRVDGDPETLHVVADSVHDNPAARKQVTLLAELVRAQPESEGRDIVQEHLGDTGFVVQVEVSGVDESDWEFELLSMVGGIGFYADTNSQELVFYEFGHDDFLLFRSPAYFDAVTGKAIDDS